MNQPKMMFSDRLSNMLSGGMSCAKDLAGVFTGNRGPKAAKNVNVNPAMRNIYEIMGVSADLSDDEFLDKVSRASFEFFWCEASPVSGLTPDSLNKPVTYSTASIGFGLTAMIIAAERGYREAPAVEARVLLMMRALSKSTTKDGMFYHFLDEHGEPTIDGYETAISTVDTGLLLMGGIAVGEYFGGEIKDISDQLIANCNWKAFSDPEHRQLYMAWEPDSKDDLTGIGKFHPVWWDYFSDEVLLCCLLGIGSSVEEHALPADSYYTWTREKNSYHPVTPGYESTKPFVHSYSGAMFTYQFAHLWIDYKNLGPDNPSLFDLDDVPAVDWYENSCSATQASWLFSVDNAQASRTYGPFGWGFTAHTSIDGYHVGAFLPRGEPNPVLFTGEVAPYGAGTNIMFDAEKSIKTMRYYYGLKTDTDEHMVWNDKSDKPYGFYDSFNLDTGFVAQQYLGIDLGPMLIAIENHRSDLIRRMTMKNTCIQTALKKVGYDVK